MIPRLWGQLPQNIIVRQIRTRSTRSRFRTRELLLIAILLDPVLYPVDSLVGLYEHRWRAELCFDEIKTTMQASAIRCLRPATGVEFPRFCGLDCGEHHDSDEKQQQNRSALRSGV
jgi:Transposase DDE domain